VEALGIELESDQAVTVVDLNLQHNTNAVQHFESPPSRKMRFTSSTEAEYCMAFRARTNSGMPAVSKP
jgi:hypothetical protein